MKLDKKWKIWVYRIGMGWSCLNPLSIIFSIIHIIIHRKNDVWKRRENPEYNGWYEKWSFVNGVFIVYALSASLIYYSIELVYLLMGLF